jgi:uroporphyrinogen decarboxylase
MSEEKLLVSAFQGKATRRVPFWFMRQAGRYLPEYRELRATCTGFMDLCFTPEKAAEVTLQPITRFDMDGAILFSDILVIPHALGSQVTFEAGEGPKLSIIDDEAGLNALSLETIHEVLAPIYETIRLVKKQLPGHTTFLGFAGAPWTVACYMLQGKGGDDFATARQKAYQQPALVKQLIDVITDATILYLKKQIETGVDAVQIFDSWAGLLTPAQFMEYSIFPTQTIVRALKADYPDIPIIGFPKGAASHLGDYAKLTGVDVLGVDQFTPLAFAKQQAGNTVLQGNLDPLLLASDKDEALRQAEIILKQFGDAPAVFNLGHGMLPHTPVAHVEALVQFLKTSTR